MRGCTRLRLNACTVCCMKQDPACRPAQVVSLSKNLCYLCMSTTAATLRTLCLAAHQAAFTVW